MYYEEELRGLRATVRVLEEKLRKAEERLSDAGWEREYLRQQQYDREQSELSKWGIYG